MNKLWIFAFLLAGMTFFASPSQAECTKAADGTITLSGTELGQCSGDAMEISYVFTFYGVCGEFPPNGRDFSSCINLLKEDATISISQGSSATVDALIPTDGTYPYTMAIVRPTMTLRGVLKFSHSVTGGDGTNVPNQTVVGTYCQPPNFEWSTDVIFSAVFPTQCSNIEPTGNALNSGSFRVTNVGLSAWSAIRTYEPDTTALDPNAALNLVLLDTNGNVATQAADVSLLAMINKPTTPVTFTPEITDISADFTTVDGFGFAYICNGGAGVDCFVYTPYVGGGGFASTVGSTR
jgi:hypothetical protein